MRRKVALAAILTLVLTPSAYLAWSWRDMPHLGIYHDDAVYWVTAKSLAEGNGYRIGSFPGQPFETKYPPLYPLLLSLVWRVNPQFPANLQLATLLSWLLLPVYLIVARRLFAEFRMSNRRSWTLALLLAVNPIVVFFSLTLMSELFFAVLLAAALVLAERGSREDAPVWPVVAAGLVGGMAFLARSIGLLLLVTAPLCYMWRKRFSRAALFAACMAPAFAGWQLWAYSHKSRSTDPVTLYYTDYMHRYLANVRWSDLPNLVWINIDCLLTGIGKLIAFTDGSFAFRLLAWLIAVAAIAGTLRLGRRTGAWQFAAYGAASLVLLAVWDYPPDARFVMPLAPLVLAGFVCECEHLVGLIRATLRRPAFADRAAAVLIASALAIFVCFAAGTAWYGMFRFTPDLFKLHRRLLADSRPVYEWISRSAPPDAQFFAYNDPLLYLYTGRRGCGLRIPATLISRSDTAGVEKLVFTLPDLARRFDLDYALFTPTDFHLDGKEMARKGVGKLLRMDPSFHLRYRGNQVAIYQLLPLTVPRRSR